MPRARNSGRRLRFKNHKEIVDWVNYRADCKEKGIKPLCHSEWRFKNEK